MINRIKPCPCGSGIRYKNCCGKIEGKLPEKTPVINESIITGKKSVGPTSPPQSQIEPRSISNTIKRKMNMVVSLFQTASGSWHIQSILIAIGWLVTGVLLFIQLSANRNERLKSFEKEQQYLIKIDKSVHPQNLWVDFRIWEPEQLSC